MPALADHIQAQDRFRYALGIEKPFGVIDHVLAWCRSSLESEWAWQLVETSGPGLNGRYIFYFNDSRDHFAFALKWC